jgi:hypothetical protein
VPAHVIVVRVRDETARHSAAKINRQVGPGELEAAVVMEHRSIIPPACRAGNAFNGAIAALQPA